MPAGHIPARPTRRDASPWCPESAGPYRLPGDVLDRLSAALAGFRNREAAFALAVFLARFWSAPGRLVLAFPVDRRKLAGRADLGLSEDRIRGALASLEEIGFVAREVPVGRGVYQRTAAGLHRRPILFRFGGEYGEAFGRANARARKAQDGRKRRGWCRAAAERVRPLAGLLSHPVGPVPHKDRQAEAGLIMGERRSGAGDLHYGDTFGPVEAALRRFGLAVIGGGRG